MSPLTSPSSPYVTLTVVDIFHSHHCNALFISHAGCETTRRVLLFDIFLTLKHHDSIIQSQKVYTRCGCVYKTLYSVIVRFLYSIITFFIIQSLYLSLCSVIFSQVIKSETAVSRFEYQFILIHLPNDVLSSS